MSIKVGDLVYVPRDGTMGRYSQTIGLVLNVEKNYYVYSKNGDRALVEIYSPRETRLYFPVKKLQTIETKEENDSQDNDAN